MAIDAAQHGLPPHAAVELDPGDHAAVEAARAQRSGGLRGRQLWASLLVGGGFLAVALPFAFLHPSARAPTLLTAAALVAAYALAYRVEFEFALGLVVPTQLVLVPMLFLLPLGLVPLAVAAVIVLANLVEQAEGRIRLDFLFNRLAAAWHVLGPVLVLAAAGEQDPTIAHWPLYLLALGAQFALEFASTSVRLALSRGLRPAALVKMMWPTWLVDSVLAPLGLLAALAAVAEPAAFLLVLPLAVLLRTFSRDRRGRIDAALELSNAYRGTAFLLGDVVEADDAYTGSHSRDVVALVLGVADQLGLDARDRRDAEFVALLHDVGKIRIPAEIINKPAALTPDERAVIEQHTLEGERMLVQVGGVLGGVGRLVRSCHEHVDGRGYPDGLVGEEIPLVARIVCCCDAFSAMTTDRPYRGARSPEEALAELRRCAGTQFDQSVVEALAKTL
ncbi:MAG TPA: HD-GYP domain-containing protein [Gaiellaceae bacterium]|nr:HD-GYP domain-containing protein [Gaiellaceae bacterium]